MPVDESDSWNPSLFPKQLEGLAACLPSKRNRVLFSGPRLSGKTLAALNCVVAHAWNTNHGNVCLVAVTQSVGIDSGIWTALTEIVLPEWINGGFGMRWCNGKGGEPKGIPHIQNVTKKPTCMVTNRYGNYSRISLESLKEEQFVEDKFKGKEYTCIFVNELSKFKDRLTLDTLVLALRSMRSHLRREDFLFLADTNPAEEGTESWIYKLWYSLRVMDDRQLMEEFPALTNEDIPDYARNYDGAAHPLIPLRDSLALVEFTVGDNESLSEDDKLALKSKFAHDPDLLLRYYYGKWVTASADALFADVFRTAIHVLPDPRQNLLEDPEILWPEEGCSSLILGLDPGPTNIAATIIEKVLMRRKATLELDGETVTEEREVPVFKVLDELIIVGEDFKMEDYIESLAALMSQWERAIGRPGQVLWHQWADQATFNAKIPFSDRYLHQLIYEASAGKMVLNSAGTGRVAVRVDLMRKLLFERRLIISGTRCPQIITMFKSIRRGNSDVAPIQKGSRWKHALDCLSYPICAELFDEVFRSVHARTRRASESSLVQVAL